MEHYELEAKEQQIRKLQLQIGEKDAAISESKGEAERYKRRALVAEVDSVEVRMSLNNLSADLGRAKRKIKRLENKGKS
ncbi:MAG: hypothetical protein V3R25_10165 [Nitrosomonadaceae bacterium]